MDKHTENQMKIIIDNDAGGDDSMAIFFALLYEEHFKGPKVIGLTTANGNTSEENVYVNNQKILKVANRQEVPIYRGAKSSIVRTPYSSHYYGYDGLGDNDDNVTDLVPAAKEHAVMALLEESKIHKDNLVVITIGTLTNIALAIRLDPHFLGRIKHLYVGAGHVSSEQYPMAEFNARMDAEAYHIIVKNATPDKVTIVPFSQVQDSVSYPRQWREDVLGKINTVVMQAQNKFERVALPKNEKWGKLDPAVVAVAIAPELVKEYKYSKNDIILCGENRGINTNTFVCQDDANVRVVYSIHNDAYQRALTEVFAADRNKLPN